MGRGSHSQETVPVAALVVGYQPDLATLDSLLLRLLSDTTLVVLLDNGGAAAFLASHPQERNRILYIDMQGNRGLGAALNRGMRAARAAGLRYVQTFDQDSEPAPGMAAAMYQQMVEGRRQGLRCAAIGPVFHDKREKGDRSFPIYREINGRIRVVVAETSSGMQEADVLITSGMLVDSDCWEAGLQYNEGLMVDYTDTDWCFRARAAGYTLYALPSQKMPHALSDTPPVRVLGVHLLRYSPLRRYYYFRNTVYFVRRAYVSRAWRKRLLAGLMARLCGNLFIDQQPIRGLAMSIKGLWHGVRGRLGPYPS